MEVRAKLCVWSSPSPENSAFPRSFWMPLSTRYSSKSRPWSRSERGGGLFLSSPLTVTSRPP